MEFYIIITLLTIIILFNFFVYFLWRKIEKLEYYIIWLFKKRNNQVTCIYQITKWYLSRTEEIYKEFFDLKRKDFWENSFNVWLNEKIITYKKIHNEIDFIFKVCEQNKKIYLNEKYLYFKDSILDKSNEIWNKLEIYNKIKKEYNIYKKISNLTIIWIFVK